MANLRTGDTALDFTLPATDGKTYKLHEAFKIPGQLQLFLLVITAHMQ